MTVLVGITAQAQQECEQPSKTEILNPGQDGQAGVLSCLGRRCYYTALKASGKRLRESLDTAVFGTFGGDDENYVQGDGREVVFWATCQDKLDELKTMVSLLDVARGRSHKREIQLKVRIAHLSNAAVNSLSFGITGIFDGIVNNVPARGSAGDGNISFAFGNLTNQLLSLNIGGFKEKNYSTIFMDEDFTVYQGDGVSIYNVANVRRDSTSSVGSTDSEPIGYTLRADEVQIDKTGDEPLVIIHDLSLFYGEAVPDKDIISKYINRSFPEVVIPRDRPAVLNATNLSVDQLNNKKGLPYLENSKVKSDSKLMVFISGWPEDSPPEVESNLIPLNKDELALVNSREFPAEDLLTKAEFSILPTGKATNFDLVQFRLNDLEALASKNRREVINVTISGSGIEKHSSLVYAEHLFTGLYQLPSVYGAKGEVEFKVKLAWADGYKNNLPRGHEKSVTYNIRHRQGLGSVSILSKK